MSESRRYERNDELLLAHARDFPPVFVKNT
jgi:hypothetical protein